MVQRLAEQPPVREGMPDPTFQDAELVSVVDGLRTVAQAIARSWT
jgi:hypothetical protein